MPQALCRRWCPSRRVGHLKPCWETCCTAPDQDLKLSTDPKFAAKLQDVICLYIDPPEHALVRSVDEKLQSRRSTVPSRGCR
jgi:hypothetical protein